MPENTETISTNTSKGHLQFPEIFQKKPNWLYIWPKTSLYDHSVV